MSDANPSWALEHPIFRTTPLPLGDGLVLQEGAYFNHVGEIYRIRVIGELDAVLRYATQVKLFCILRFPGQAGLPAALEAAFEQINKDVSNTVARAAKRVGFVFAQGGGVMDTAIERTKQLQREADNQPPLSGSQHEQPDAPILPQVSVNPKSLLIDLEFYGLASTLATVNNARSLMHNAVNATDFGDWLDHMKRESPELEHATRWLDRPFGLHFKIDPEIQARQTHGYILRRGGDVTIDLTPEGNPENIGGSVKVGFTNAQANPPGKEAVTDTLSVNVISVNRQEGSLEIVGNKLSSYVLSGDLFPDKEGIFDFSPDFKR